MPRPSKGFTLVELILVIVLLGIISTATFSYLRLGTQMYAEAAERDRLLSQSRFVIERLTRELRNAAPNSVRVFQDGQCLEFIPLLVAGRYSFLPGLSGPAADSLTLFTSLATEVALNQVQYVTVNPAHAAHYYAPSSERTSPVIEALLEGQGGAIRLLFSQAKSFASNSASQRAYLWQAPVRYCVLPSGGAYSVYRFQAGVSEEVPPMLSQLLAEPGVLMAEQVVVAGPVFHFSAGVSARQAVVHVVLAFSSHFADDLFFNQEIHLPNVP